MAKTAKERLFRYISIDRKTDCWEWQAYRTKYGYGSFFFEGTMKLAHRASWTIHRGLIPSGMDVLHHCDNPPCVNPDHLYLGTDIENVADKMRRGRYRSKHFRGEENATSKLTNKQIIKIRKLAETGELSQAAIAKSFGVSQSLVCMIHKRKIWTHL